MHQWHFFKAGGFDQVSLARGSDFANLDQLDQKLWVALSCPTQGLQFDAATLALIDSDGDKRIRASELLAAIRWALQHLVSADELLAGTADLPLAAISTASAEGAAMVAAAQRVLREMGREGAATIDLAAAEGAAELLAARPLNGDGLVTVESSADAKLQVLIQAMIDCGHGATDRSGRPGVGAPGAAAFSATIDAFLAWHAEATSNAASLLPAGETATAAAWDAVQQVRAKVNDYFARCRLISFDPRAEAALNREESAWLAVAARDLGISVDEIRAFPLARVGGEAILDLDGALNPAWACEMRQFRDAAVGPLLAGQATLSETTWNGLVARLQPFAEWLARKPTIAMDGYDTATLLEWRSASTQTALTALIAADSDLAGTYGAMSDLVRLIRYRRDLAGLCCNFVNFRDFYEKDRQAIFQYGTLYLDQRSCTLCLPVSDAGRHATLAGMAGAYLAYCDCVRMASGEKMQIVAAFTGGDSDNLLVGRNGVFYDRDGCDWDATIVRIVDNPINVRQAFWSPYKKVARFIEAQAAKRAAAAEAAGEQKMQSTVVMVSAAPADKAAVPAKKIDVGTVAALGVALGSLGTAFGYFLKTVADVKGWQLPLLLAAIVLMISGPSMIMAWLKLRRRNLAPLLDANGWAVNARALINVPFGASLTGVAALPPGSRSSTADSYAPQVSSWPRLALAVFLLWWVYAFLSDQGYLQALLGN